MLICSNQLIDETIQHLQDGGRKEIEVVVLWLGALTGNGQQIVSEVYHPQQQAATDRFYLPPESMRNIMCHLQKTRTRILAQIHSHPRAAFHSQVDDEWAIVRHVGAASLVIPDFAQHITAANFRNQVVVYRLSSSNKWEQAEFNSLVEIH